MPTPVLVRNRSWTKVGRRVALVTPECLSRCCDGCPLWTRVFQCDTGPRCVGGSPPFVEAWICASVTCIDGRPLVAGMVFLLDGVCWTVGIEQDANPAGTRIQGRDPVECVTNCADERCPQGEQWLLSNPCRRLGQRVYVCGVTVCGVYELGQYGCAIVDPASGYIPGSALPPNAITFNAGGLTPRPSCCDCIEQVDECERRFVAQPSHLANSFGACDENPPCLLSVDTCCCERDPETSLFFGRVRLLEATQTRRDIWRPGFGISGEFFGYLGAETIDPVTGFALYERFIRREGFGGPPEITRLSDIGFGSACGWADNVPMSSSYAVFDASLGRWQCSDCPDQNIVDVSFNALVTCTEMTILNTYRTVTPNFTQTIENVFRARIINHRPCGGGCGGRAASSSGLLMLGCRGCGGTQVRERA